MPKNPITASLLLASFWIDSETHTDSDNPPLERLRRFAAEKRLPVSESILAKAAAQLGSRMGDGDVEGWVVFLSFCAHPDAIWAFMLGAMDAARTDDHLEKIAVSLAESLLAHYGSMLPHFEARAACDARFARMLTGVWRCRMSGRVWTRLREMQATVPDPLPAMIPPEHGVEWGADRLTLEDRATDDKGLYIRGPDANWVKRRRD